MSVSVQSLIPHRKPFLFVDTITQINEESCEANFFVDPQLDFFKGHFPDYPIMPGVLQVEAIGQTCACVMSYAASNQKNQNKFFLAASKGTKFLSQVLPGDHLTFKVQLKRKRSGFYVFDGVATNQNGTITTEAEVMLCIDGTH